MKRFVKRLIEVSSASIGREMSHAEVIEGLASASALSANALADLADLWVARNGMYTFESAFHLLPLRSDHGLTVAAWNEGQLWRGRYEGLADGWLFFAQDLFGGQFCVKGSSFATFDPETGEVEMLADTLEGFAEALLDDFSLLTGHPIAHDWQTRHGALKQDIRLEAIQPFVLGGQYSIDNLRERRAEQLLQDRAALAVAIRDRPDGAKLRWPPQ